jgi:3-oxoacyl-[acyl-carrier-protein] synthase-3
MEELELPEEKAIKIMHEFGYMGSACLPVAFDLARERKLIKEGDLVVFVGSGVGYNQCAAAFRL